MQQEKEGDSTLSRVFIASSCFRFISPNCSSLERSLCCVFFFYCSYDPLEVPRLTLLWQFSSLAFLLFLPAVQLLATLVRCPQKHSFPSHLSLSPSLHLRSTQTADPLHPLPPSSPMIHLLPAGFHAAQDSCLNVYAKSYFPFLYAPIFQNELCGIC